MISIFDITTGTKIGDDLNVTTTFSSGGGFVGACECAYDTNSVLFALFGIWPDGGGGAIVKVNNTDGEFSYDVSDYTKDIEACDNNGVHDYAGTCCNLIHNVYNFTLTNSSDASNYAVTMLPPWTQSSNNISCQMCGITNSNYNKLLDLTCPYGINVNARSADLTPSLAGVNPALGDQPYLALLSQEKQSKTNITTTYLILGEYTGGATIYNKTWWDSKPGFAFYTEIKSEGSGDVLFDPNYNTSRGYLWVTVRGSRAGTSPPSNGEQATLYCMQPIIRPSAPTSAPTPISYDQFTFNIVNYIDLDFYPTSMTFAGTSDATTKLYICGKDDSESSPTTGKIYVYDYAALYDDGNSDPTIIEVDGGVNFVMKIPV